MRLKLILPILLFSLFPISTLASYFFPNKIDTKQERIDVQTVLNIVMTPSPHLSIDGILGKKSIEAIKVFQSSKGLLSDGILGPLTRSALEKAQTDNTNQNLSTLGCLSGSIYNTETGKLCSTISSPPSGCTGTNKFSTITGLFCYNSPYIANYNSSGGSSGRSSGGGGSNNTVNTDCSGSSTQSCTITNGTGSQSRTCNSGTWSSYGSCTLKSCNTGYTVSDNTCVQNVTDTTKPTVTSFTIQSIYSSLILPISTFTATDDTAVTDYLITETSSIPLSSNSSWALSAPPTYTFINSGLKTLYAWARDAVGNISDSLNSSTVITSKGGSYLSANHLKSFSSSEGDNDYFIVTSN